MRNIKLTIQYDGTRYAGWQFQKNAVSIQEVMERALKDILREKAQLIASGRTDSGVHARGQIANFKTRSRMPLKNLQMALNSILPKDIVITHIEEVPFKFNSQHNAKTKLYRYTLVNNDFVDPFVRIYAAKCFFKLDTAAMRRGARFLLGKHDFTAFKTNDNMGKRDAVRRIRKIGIEKSKDMIYIDIEADGFLYNMARNIVGTLIEVGRGKITEDRIKEILSKRDRRLCGPAAPAKGLCLVKVKY